MRGFAKVITRCVLPRKGKVYDKQNKKWGKRNYHLFLDENSIPPCWRPRAFWQKNFFFFFFFFFLIFFAYFLLSFDNSYVKSNALIDDTDRHCHNHYLFSSIISFLLTHITSHIHTHTCMCVCMYMCIHVYT